MTIAGNFDLRGLLLKAQEVGSLNPLGQWMGPFPNELRTLQCTEGPSYAVTNSLNSVKELPMTLLWVVPSVGVKRIEFV